MLCPEVVKVNYLFAALLGYLLGSANLTYFLSKARGIDARKNGSGNLGASNATVLMGWYAGAAVALHDGLKAAIAVWVCQFMFPETAHVGALAGIASVLGHIFPFYLGFRGGKGLASYMGMTMALDWRVALAVLVLGVILTVATDYIAIATISVATVVPVILGVIKQSLILAGILLLGTVVMYFKHIENIRRIRSGTEIGLRSTAKGENRIK